MTHLQKKNPGRRVPAWCLLLAGLLLLWRGVGHAQVTTAALRKDLKKDFGAVGDGRTNDQAAFEKAADFFNKRAQTPAGTAPAVLAIPKGVYLVGRQDAAGNGADVLALTGCRNLRIVGQDSALTLIRYAEGLRYGAFDPATRQPYESPKAFFTDWAWGARVGTCINLQKCENVEVSGLDLDG